MATTTSDSFRSLLTNNLVGNVTAIVVPLITTGRAVGGMTRGESQRLLSWSCSRGAR